MSTATKDKLSLADLKKMITEIVDAKAAELYEKNAGPGNESVAKMMEQLLALRQSDITRLPGVSEKGTMAARFVTAMARAKGDYEKGVKELKKEFPAQEHIWQKAVTVDTGGTEFIMPVEVSSDFIELLRPLSAIRRMNPIVLPMAKNTLQIPKLSGGGTASYIGSNDDIGTTKPTFGMLQMTFKKLAAIVPVSNDVIRFSSPGADMLVRDDLVRQVGTREDQAFIRDDGTENTPKGLYYWAPSSNKIQANATVNLANVTIDLGKLILALMNSNVRMIRPGWVFAPRTYIYLMTVQNSNGVFVFRDEMLRGTLWGYPFAVTTNIPITLNTNKSEVYFADFADVVIGESMNVQLDASPTAAYSDSGSVVSSFSRDQTVIRIITEHDLGVRHDEAVAVLYDVTWGV